MPQIKRARLRYTTTIDLDPSVSTPFVRYTFRANDLYDPDATGTGQQPMGYDQLAAFYPTWAVVGSRIRVKMYSTDVNPVQIPCLYGVSTNNDILPYTGQTQTTILEQPGVSWSLIPTWAGASQSGRGCSASYSARKWWGIKSIYDVSEFWGQTASGPAYNTFFNVFAAAADGTSNIGRMFGIVTIDFSVVFRNPMTLSGS